MRYLCLLFVCAAIARAQDPFEIHVYEYEPLPRGDLTYEAHLNYVLQGTKLADGTVAPANDQLHYTSELTAGITDELRAAVVLLTARRAGQAWEYAGFRVLPHMYAPQSWHLPLNLGFVAEFSFESTKYEEDSRHIELRPIIEKHVGRLQLDGNPVFAHALRGPGTGRGWIFEPAARIAWQTSSTFTPSVEYYGSWGPAANLLPVREQIHQVFPGADVKLGEHVTWNFGVGFGLAAGSSVIVKTHFEFEFGRAK